MRYATWTCHKCTRQFGWNIKPETTDEGHLYCVYCTHIVKFPDGYVGQVIGGSDGFLLCMVSTMAPPYFTIIADSRTE